MNAPLNATHDPALRSWVDSANDEASDFPIQNLPLGVFRRRGKEPSIGVAIGSMIFDLSESVRSGSLTGLPVPLVSACRGRSLNGLMALGTDAWSALRARLVEALREGSADHSSLEPHLLPVSAAEMQLPCDIGDYTDFYASLHHAVLVGSMFRPDNPLLPNYKYVPIGYHGRSSSIVPDGTPVRRPSGQTHDDRPGPPRFGPSHLLDYELEVGCFVGTGSAMGRPPVIAAAEEEMFGLCLVNDWSARDIQKWEYQPLGPFLAKNFATTISPWIVTMEALRPFRVPLAPRPEGDPEPLPYLNDPHDARAGGIDIILEVHLATPAMRAGGREAARLSRASFRDMYWTFAQMLTHHASNGCNLRAGDLIASGTVSGPGAGERGCLLELTERGNRPLTLPGGEERRFLADGDEVIMRGWCERKGFRRIGFGRCSGTILPSLQL